jgi:5-methylcytosine-specific restriction endonuclease McrA
VPTKPPVACSQCDRGICSKHGQVPATPSAALEKPHTHQKEYQYLYDRGRWRNPKTGLKAACFRHYPICVDPFKIGCRQPTTVADHIIDHNGNEQLFFDFKNLQGLCEQCHNRKTASTHGKGGKDITPCQPALVDGRINA